MGIQHTSVENQHFKELNGLELFDFALNKTHQHGFEYFFLRTTPILGATHSNSSYLTNYPNEVVEYYQTNGAIYKNALVIQCQHSIDPIIWDESIFRKTPVLWQKTQLLGLHFGWSQSVYDVKGMTSMLSLARSSPPITCEEFNAKAADVLLLCNQLHKAMLAKIPQKHKTLSSLDHLSLREIEVLKWTAQGKTASDVGMILDLTTRTVNFHISSAIKKLGTSNKTSAVVLATQLGII